VMADEFYIPSKEDIRHQSTTNKQGRGEEVPPQLQKKVIEVLKRDQVSVYANYEEMIKDDVARELARINLPLSLYTQWYWQIDLHNLFHFLRLRMDHHAQKEIQVYGEVMAMMAKAVAPMAYEAFEEHILYGVRLSRGEVVALREILAGKENPLKGKALEDFNQKITSK
jgi:thymidylate synthase (FAD)